MNKAFFIKNLNGFSGEAKLFKLVPPITYEDLDITYKAAYVVVSAVIVMFTGAETYIFPADKNGTVLSWMGLDGSFRGELNHRRALENAGYTWVEE